MVNAWSGRSSAISGRRPVVRRGKVRDYPVPPRATGTAVRHLVALPEQTAQRQRYPIDQLRVQTRTSVRDGS